MEYTFVMIRPGAIRRKKVDYIFSRIAEIGLNIEYCEYRTLTPEFVCEHLSILKNLFISSRALSMLSEAWIRLSGLLLGSPYQNLIY